MTVTNDSIDNIEFEGQIYNSKHLIVIVKPHIGFIALWHGINTTFSFNY